MNTAIIVAAGSSTRFVGDKPKQLTELLGKPLVFHTLSIFEACDVITDIILVLSENAIADVERSPHRHQITKLTRIVAGGSCRAASVQNGLAIVASGTKVVAVHDGARPLVAVHEVSATVESALDFGAACLVGEVNDTIKMVRGGEIAATLDRGQLRRALTPQAFRLELLREAYECGEVSEKVTDECFLVEKLGHPIVCVEGSSRNIKVTRREDLLLAEFLLSKQDLDSAA